MGRDPGSIPLVDENDLLSLYRVALEGYDGPSVKEKIKKLYLYHRFYGGEIKNLIFSHF